MSLPEPEEVLFREVQQFRQPWLWAVVLAWPAIMLLVFGYGLFRQAVLGQPWGNSPMPTDALALATCVPTVVVLCFAWLFYAVKLITEVRRDGLYIRFWPLAWRRIGYDQIVECEARVYHPIREYGGWGIRWGLKGKAYNVSGNRGVQLVLAGKKRLLIGSQRPDELEAAVNTARAAATG